MISTAGKINAPAEFDPPEIVANRVETGEIPDSFMAEQRGASKRLIRARPICAHPKTASLIAGKDVDKPGSYQCTEP
ncbi:hypothetical protein ACJJIK_11490 [Microbulbifer sp. ZKSA006]|uniref:hypothetical protein n=1 Tax=Microbulbifer sp. ZKSA006 TaxID=3243390 RepID=UPI004039F581